jgi:hypothetical protein
LDCFTSLGVSTSLPRFTSLGYLISSFTYYITHQLIKFWPLWFFFEHFCSFNMLIVIVSLSIISQIPLKYLRNSFTRWIFYEKLLFIINLFINEIDAFIHLIKVYLVTALMVIDDFFNHKKLFFEAIFIIIRTESQL